MPVLNFSECLDLRKKLLFSDKLLEVFLVKLTLEMEILMVSLTLSIF